MANVKEEIVLAKHENKSDVVYIRITSTLKTFVDGIAKRIGVTRSEAIRRLLEDAQNKGVKVE